MVSHAGSKSGFSVHNWVKLWKRLHHILYTTVDLHLPLSSLTHIDDNSKQTFKMWLISYSVRQTSAYSPRFPSLRMTSWRPPLQTRPYLIVQQQQDRDHPNSHGLHFKTLFCWQCFLGLTVFVLCLSHFKYCTAADRALYAESPCCCKNTMLCLSSTVWYLKYIWDFMEIHLKKWE